MERRFITSREIRASGSSKAPQISGYAATFNSPTMITTQNGSFREQIKPGAFSRAIREADDVCCLFNHNDMYVLGRISAGTLRLKQTDRGLFYECDIPDTQAGRDTHTSIQRGDISGCSFAFEVGEDDQDWDMDERGLLNRNIRNVRSLIDVSPVTHPAYASTSVSARELELVNAEIRSGKLRRQRLQVSPEKVREALQGKSWEQQLEERDAAIRRRRQNLFNELL
jgi:HK97 family phage prohead protease